MRCWTPLQGKKHACKQLWYGMVRIKRSHSCSEGRQIATKGADADMSLHHHNSSRKAMPHCEDAMPQFL
eukprot:253503-Chlamydomonas_euryale.AAC.1